MWICSPSGYVALPDIQPKRFSPWPLRISLILCGIIEGDAGRPKKKGLRVDNVTNFALLSLGHATLPAH